jgi:hypothetical protein
MVDSFRLADNGVKTRQGQHGGTKNPGEWNAVHYRGKKIQSPTLKA